MQHVESLKKLSLQPQKEVCDFRQDDGMWSAEKRYRIRDVRMVWDYDLQ